MIGPNGAGKTTLFRMIVGDEEPDSGALRLGESVELAYVDQSRDALDPEKSVWEEISGGMDAIKVGEREMNSRAYVGGFNFKGSDQQRKVGTLSGGERNRVHLAKLLRAGGNLLLLDEPTNDLDVDTLRALEEALLAFAGCAVVISHDRWFLDRVATHVLAFEGDSAGALVRGQLRGLRGEPPRAPRPRGRPAAPDHLQAPRRPLREMSQGNIEIVRVAHPPSGADLTEVFADVSRTVEFMEPVSVTSPDFEFFGGDPALGPASARVGPESPGWPRSCASGWSPGTSTGPRPWNSSRPMTIGSWCCSGPGPSAGLRRGRRAAGSLRLDLP